MPNVSVDHIRRRFVDLPRSTQLPDLSVDELSPRSSLPAASRRAQIANSPRTTSPTPAPQQHPDERAPAPVLTSASPLLQTPPREQAPAPAPNTATTPAAPPSQDASAQSTTPAATDSPARQLPSVELGSTVVTNKPLTPRAQHQLTSANTSSPSLPNPEPVVTSNRNPVTTNEQDIAQIPSTSDLALHPNQNILFTVQPQSIQAETTAEYSHDERPRETQTHKSNSAVEHTLSPNGQPTDNHAQSVPPEERAPFYEFPDCDTSVLPIPHPSPQDRPSPSRTRAPDLPPDAAYLDGATRPHPTGRGRAARGTRSLPNEMLPRPGLSVTRSGRKIVPPTRFMK